MCHIVYRVALCLKRWETKQVLIIKNRTVIPIFIRKKLQKIPLVNETFRHETRDETETFGFQSETRPRPRPSHISPRPRRDRDIGKIGLETVSRPRRRDRDYNPGMWTVGIFVFIFPVHMGTENLTMMTLMGISRVPRAFNNCAIQNCLYLHNELVIFVFLVMVELFCFFYRCNT